MGVYTGGLSNPLGISKKGHMCLPLIGRETQQPQEDLYAITRSYLCAPLLKQVLF